MKTLTTLVTLLSAGVLSAQDLDSRIQMFGEFVKPTEIVVGAGPVKSQPGNATGIGIKFMGEIASARNWYYEVGGKFDSSSYFDTATAAYDFTDVRFLHSYWMVGAAYLIKPNQALSIGIHAQARGEALSARGTVYDVGTGSAVGDISASSTYLRPWFAGSIDFTFPMGSLRPYVGFEGAFTPLKTSQASAIPALDNWDARTVRALAPKFTGSVYFGLRF